MEVVPGKHQDALFDRTRVNEDHRAAPAHKQETWHILGGGRSLIRLHYCLIFPMATVVLTLSAIAKSKEWRHTVQLCWEKVAIVAAGSGNFLLRIASCGYKYFRETSHGSGDHGVHSHWLLDRTSFSLCCPLLQISENWVRAVVRGEGESALFFRFHDHNNILKSCMPEQSYLDFLWSYQESADNRAYILLESDNWSNPMRRYLRLQDQLKWKWLQNRRPREGKLVHRIRCKIIPNVPQKLLRLCRQLPRATDYRDRVQTSVWRKLWL